MIRACRITFSPKSKVGFLLASDSQETHAFTMKSVPHDNTEHRARAQSNLLWRMDIIKGCPTLTVQSDDPATDFSKWDAAPGVVNIQTVDDVLGRLGDRTSVGSQVRFMIRANPVRRNSGSNRRVPITDEQEMLDWMIRSLSPALEVEREEHSGLPELMLDREPVVKVEPRGIFFNSASFWGSARITDAERFQTMVAEGVGRGRAFGLGLLQVG